MSIADWIKRMTLKLRTVFSLVDVLRAQTQHTGSQTAQRDCSEEVSEEPGYIGALHKPGN